MVDVWAKIGRAVKKGAEAAKNVLLLVPRALAYPVRRPLASLDAMKHDAAVSLRWAVGMDVPREERKYDPPIETTEGSKNLGVEVSFKDRKIKFLASRTLTGDISYMTPEQLNKIGELNLNKGSRHSSIALFREENKVVIEINVRDITNKVEGASENREKGPEEIKKLVLKGIYGEVDRNLKGLAKITGGEFKVHTDQKLLHGIVKKLYREYGERLSEAASKELSNTAGPSELVSKITTEGNMTNPLLAYYQEVAGGKTNGVKFPSKGQRGILEKFGSGLSGPEDTSDKPKESLFAPIVEGNAKREKGGRS